MIGHQIQTKPPIWGIESSDCWIFCEFLYNFSLAQGSQVDGAIYVVFQGSVGFYRAAPGLMWREDEGGLSKWWLYDPQRATKLCETVGSWITWDAIEWYLAEIFG